MAIVDLSYDGVRFAQRNGEIMKIRHLIWVPAAMLASEAAHAQVNEIEVTDGTNATCYTPNGPLPCGFFTEPTIDILVDDGAGNSSEVTTTTNNTRIRTADGTNTSGLNVQSGATALESRNAAIGYAAIGTQLGTSTASGLVTGQVAAVAEDTSGGQSSFNLEGQVAAIRTIGVSGERGFLETTATRTLLGYSANGAELTTGLRTTATNNSLIGNTDVAGSFMVSGSSLLNGVDNAGAGITNAGLISGVTAGSVTAASSDAVNGAQLFATNTNVAVAQTSANTALATSATAQTSADNAQITANTALAAASGAQTTANAALSSAAMAQSTANTALGNAATAQTSADNAQTTANTALAAASGAQTTASSALSGVTTAQTTANTALANAATAQTSADNAQTRANVALTNSAAAQLTAATANTNASTALGTANAASANAAAALTQTANAVQYDSAAHTSVTLNPGSTAVSLRNIAAGVSPSDAVNVSQLSTVTNNLTALGSRVNSLESLVQNVDNDIRRIDRLAGRGVAIATALASIPPINGDQKFGVGFGFGTYDGRSAFSAALIGRINDNTQFRLNAGTTGNGKVAAGGGMTFGW